jgi:UDP-N-acetylmuramate--alanine ligase
VKTEDIVIYSSATAEREEVKTAKKLKETQHVPLLMWDYFEFLGEMSKYFKTIAFTGTNGKSSSSAMGIYVAKNVVENFGLGIVGALVPDFGGQSYCLGKNKTDLKQIFDFIFTGKHLDATLIKKYSFFLEACEYQRHFLTLDIDTALITSLELEHTDYFKDWQDYQSAFLALIEKLKGKVFVLPNLQSETILQHEKTLIVQPQRFNFQHLWGEHQQQNASLVFGVLDQLTGGKKKEEIKKQIEGFSGIWRRMEELTTLENGVKIFSDYGHVASSLVVGLEALREKFPDRKITCIFQPHQMHRILQGWEEFPKALSGYDETFIYNIYAARENFRKITEDFNKITGDFGRLQKISSIEELGEMFAEHCGSAYLKTFDEVEKVIKKAEKDSIIVVYSAGDIDYELRQYLNRITA